jgi:hypothetical protein
MDPMMDNQSRDPADHAPTISTVRVIVEDPDSRACYQLTVPGRSPNEAIDFLAAAGGGGTGQGGFDLFAGTTLEPVRNAYKARLEQLEAQIAERRIALGANPSEAALRDLAEWAVRERASTARLWRLPTGPTQAILLELRDWRQYGMGGRTFGNMMARQAGGGATGSAAYEALLLSANRSNPAVTAAVARGARSLRFGGGVLSVIGLAASAGTIAAAPPEQRRRVAAEAGVGFVGGAVAGEVATGILMVGAALLAASPPGWLVIGVGLAAGIAGGNIATHYFFPEDHAPVANRMSSGRVVDCSELARVCRPK